MLQSILLSCAALHGPSSYLSRRALLQTTAASTLALTAAPMEALAKKKDYTPAPTKCYDTKFNEVPCGGAIADDDGGAASIADRSTGRKLDPNNFIAADYAAFPGLYPTIGGKLYKRAQNFEFTSKQQVYDTLESDAERKVLRAFDKDLVIAKQDAQALASKLSTAK